MTFASPVPTVRPSFLALIRPFGIIVWILTVIVVILSGVIFYAVSNIEVVAMCYLIKCLLFNTLFLNLRDQWLGFTSRSGQKYLNPFGIATAQ